MALRFERVYIRELSETKDEDLRGFSPEIVTEILDLLSSVYPEPDEGGPPMFRIEWGGEFLNLRMASKEILVPYEGSARLFGSQKFMIPLTPAAFTFLAKDATKVMVFEGRRRTNLLTTNFFDTVRVIHYIDYIMMVSELEIKRKLTVHKSTNILSTSGLRFKFQDPADIAKYGAEPYEVDSLGTSIFAHISKTIEDMWRENCPDPSTQVKDAPGES